MPRDAGGQVIPFQRPDSEDPVTSLRQQPVNTELEQRLLGGLLANNKYLEQVSLFLQPQHFSVHAHGEIYRAMADRYARGSIADAISLRSDLSTNEVMNEVGGVKYLADLLAGMVSPTISLEYAKEVHDLWGRRQLIEYGTRVLDRAFAEPQAATQLSVAYDLLVDLEAGVRPSVAREQGITLRAAVEAELNRLDGVASGRERSVVPTGYQTVDKALGGGLSLGKQHVLGGRPSQGKTSLAIGIAINVATTGQPVLYLGLEPSSGEIARRTIALLSGAPLYRLREGKHGDYGWAIVQAQRLVAEIPMTIVDAGAMTVASMFARARAAQRRYAGRLGLIVIDYMQLVAKTERDQRMNEVEHLAKTSHMITRMAKELGAAVLTLSMLNRQIDTREDKRPVMGDLVGTGAIEADAETIGLLYREETYLRQQQPRKRDGEGEENYAQRMSWYRQRQQAAKDRAELIYAKIREGEPQTVVLAFNGPCVRFQDLPS